VALAGENLMAPLDSATLTGLLYDGGGAVLVVLALAWILLSRPAR
jgi:hypothetical protein